MRWLVISGRDVIDEMEILRSIGMWSDDSSLRFDTWTRKGRIMIVISGILSLWKEKVGKCIGESGIRM